MSKIESTSGFYAGVRDLVRLVSSTMGPAGHNVIVTSGDTSAVFRDGAQVVRAYIPNDPIERNAVIRLRDAAESSLRFAGDSTSTTAVFLGSLYMAVEDAIAEQEKKGVIVQRRLVTDRLEAILTAMETYVTENAIKVTHKNGKINRELLQKVATVAANNDAEIGAVVADLITRLGHSGGVRIEYSKTGKVETEVNAGYVFNAGLVSPHFLPPGERTVMVENPYIVLANDTIATQADLKKIADGFNQHSFMKNEGRWLIIVCSDMAGVALATSIARQHADQHGNPTGRMLPLLVIGAPKDINSKMFFEEMSAATGAKVISREAGAPIHNFDWLRDVGTAASVVSSLGTTSVQYLDHNKPGRVTVSKLLERLEKEAEAANRDDVSGFKDRINRLKGTVGTIRIPGNTQGEVFMNKEVIEDSYMACQAAIQHGVLPGCGRAMWNAYANVDFAAFALEERLAMDCIEAAITSTVLAVVQNAGGDKALVIKMLDQYSHSAFSGNTQNVFVVDGAFMLYAQMLTRGNAPVVETQSSLGKVFGKTAKQGPAAVVSFENGILADNYRDAIDAGVLDSAGGILAALRNTRSEISLWVMTKHIINQ